MIFRKYTLIVFFAALILLPAANASAQERGKIPEAYKWNLQDIYPNWDAWELGLKETDKKMAEITALKGTLGKGPDRLLAALTLRDELGQLAFKVFRYPQLTRDTDTRNHKVAGRLQQVQILFAKFGTATSWIKPEILQIPKETMMDWLDTTPGLAPHRFGLEDLYRKQAHVLDEEKETLLSYYSQFRAVPGEIYTELSVSDIDFPSIKLSDGKEFKTTPGNYSKVLAGYRNQEDRKKIFETHYRVYEKNINTYAAIYNAVCKRDWAKTRALNYETTLDEALDEDHIPPAVYKNLVETVKANPAPFQRYQKLRARVLGLKDYHFYDSSINLSDFSREYPYDTAGKWIIASVAPLGKDYAAGVKRALSGGWIDVYENTGKRGGAYSADVYGVHPYMLLNYNDTLDNVFTLAHELGHTLHSMLASKHQPFATHGYSIFVAEVASTFNERLLLDYLLKRSKDPGERIALLQQAIRNLNGTFLFQILLADFELQAHQLVEQGKPITAAVLNNIMAGLFKSYYGDSVARDELMDVVWARIPHLFNTPYYVYQYATSYAASAQLYNQVTRGTKKERKAALGRYLDLLKSGGSDYPMNQLKKAGADLEKPGTVLAVIQQMDDMVTLLEKELKKTGKIK